MSGAWHSKNEVSRAGDIVVSPASTEGERAEAKSIINYWRRVHKAPLQLALNDMSMRAEAVGNPLVVGRIKKLGTIIDKLMRSSTPSNLKTMYDIAGCRAVVEDMNQFGDLCRLLAELPACHGGKSLNRDYVENPKKSGYRGRHFICCYEVDEYDQGLWSELQVRTSLQHAWATAVEMYDLIEPGSRLKFNEIGTPAGRFFQLASWLIECEEMSYASRGKLQIVSELKAIEASHGILSALTAGSESSTVIEGDATVLDAGFCLVDFIKDEQSIVLRNLDASVAVDAYFAAENDGGAEHDFVLVKGSSIDQIKLAYPNYFSDISMFVNYIREKVA